MSSQILTTSNLAALLSLVEAEIDNNASLDEFLPNEAYLYAILGKLYAMHADSELTDMINADQLAQAETL
jgi:hypothetical protein